MDSGEADAPYLVLGKINQSWDKLLIDRDWRQYADKRL